MVQAYGIGAVLFAAFNYASYAETLPAAQALFHAIFSAAGIVVSGIIIICFYNGENLKSTEVFKVVFLYFLSGTSADLKFDQNVDRIKDAEKMYQIDC